MQRMRPPSDKPKRVEAWWDWASPIIKTRCDDPGSTVVMIDGNCRVAKDDHGLIGDQYPQHPDTGGARLASLAADMRLKIPQAFKDLAVDGPQGTWTSKSGKTHRIDYVLVPEAWLAQPRPDRERPKGP